MTSKVLLTPGLRPSIGEFKYLSHQTLVDLADWISQQQEYLEEWYEEVADLPELDDFTIKQIRSDINMDMAILETAERIIDEMFNQEETNDEEIRKGVKQCQE